MGVIMKIINVICILLLHVLFPQQIASAIKNRCRRSYEALHGVYEIRIIGNILIFPIKLVLSLSLAIIKIVFIWILPASVYYNIKFAIYNLIYEDITVKKIRPRIALKRVYLFFVMCVKGRQRRVSYGEKNPDKTFFVIRPYYFLERNELVQNVSNLLFHYYRNLQHLAYGLENGWIPVVDWENYGPFAHGEKFPINGTRNCWEYYWQQPSPYTLEEVYQSKNVILSVQNTRDNQYVPSCFFSKNLQKQAEDLAVRCPKYDMNICLNEYTKIYIDSLQKDLFKDGKKILGVSVRGTSYGNPDVLTNVSGHPIQPDLVTLINSVDNLMQEWKMDYIFITCELDSIINDFKNHFGNKTLYIPRLRYTKSPQRGDVEKGLDPLYVEGNKYKTNLDYLAEMVLLSRCNSLAAAMSSGVRAAIIWNANKYEHMKIFENGLW